MFGRVAAVRRNHACLGVILYESYNTARQLASNCFNSPFTKPTTMIVPATPKVTERMKRTSSRPVGLRCQLVTVSHPSVRDSFLDTFIYYTGVDLWFCIITRRGFAWILSSRLIRSISIVVHPTPYKVIPSYASLCRFQMLICRGLADVVILPWIESSDSWVFPQFEPNCLKSETLHLRPQLIYDI